MKSKLPKTVVVVLEQEGTDKEYLRCEKQVRDAAEQDVKKRGGIYKLKQLITVETITKVTPVPSSKMAAAQGRPRVGRRARRG